MTVVTRIGKCWYVVYTKPRQEEAAVSNLSRQGYEVYCPQTLVVRVRQGGRRFVIEPLFQRYIFIRLDSQSDNWAPIRSTFGVTSLIRFGAVPARVLDSLVEYLKSHENAEGLHELVKPALAIGARARVVSGSFAGYEGILLAIGSRERGAILMDLVGGHFRVKLTLDQVEPAVQ